MGSSQVRGSARRTAPDRRVRTLAATWWVAALVMTPPFLMLMVASDFLQDRYPGAVLGVMVLGAAWVAGRLPGWSPAQGRPRSLIASALWLAGAALVYPTQEFAADAAYATGVPVVAALVTALLALRLRAPAPRS